MTETAKGGPFQEILDVDIFVNCIYLTSKIPSFVTPEQITAAGRSRKLSVVVDVSCDTTNPNNPIPIYSINTTFDAPTVPVALSCVSLFPCTISNSNLLIPAVRMCLRYLSSPSTICQHCSLAKHLSNSAQIFSPHWRLSRSANTLVCGLTRRSSSARSSRRLRRLRVSETSEKINLKRRRHTSTLSQQGSQKRSL